jgi:hypothetical protein
MLFDQMRRLPQESIWSDASGKTPIWKTSRTPLSTKKKKKYFSREKHTLLFDCKEHQAPQNQDKKMSQAEMIKKRLNIDLPFT